MNGNAAGLEREDRSRATGTGYITPRRRAAEPRLDRLFEAQCDRLAAHGMSHQIAIYGGGAALTYQELDRRANHLARYLLAQGAETADRIGLFLEQGSDYYIAMLAILKVQATYVPLDPDSPLDRNSYIAADAGIRMLITRTALTDRLPAHRDPAVTVVLIDALEMDINRHSRTRLPRRFSTHRGGAVAAVI